MRSTIISIFLLFSIIFPTSIFAYQLEAKQGVVKDGYNFWLYEPDGATDNDTDEVGWPLVVFLHGSSLCGNNLAKVKRYGTINAIERGRKIDAYVIAPQNPGGAWSPAKVMNDVDWVCAHKNIDRSRIYVIGMSLGGYGAIDLAAAYPDRIAAAMAFCGGGTHKNIAALSEVPLWIVHGTADRAIAVSESDRVVSKIKESDPEAPRLHYDRIPGMNHSQPARFFYLDECYKWLLSHSLDDEGRPVTEKFDIAGTARNAYKDLNYYSGGAKSSIGNQKPKSSKKTISKKSKKRKK